MEARAPYSGGSVHSGGAAEPITTERLEEVKRHLAARKHWPAFLHGGWANGCPEDVEEALAWMASGAVGLLDIASVGPLVPICNAFKGLIQAAEGAAEVDAHLRELIAWCAFLLTEVLLKHGKEVGALAKLLEDFESVTDDLAKRAKRLAGRWKCTALLCFAWDGKQIQEFDVKLRNIWNDIQGVTIMAVAAELRAARPPQPGEMAQIPQRAPDLPPAFVERGELVEAVAQDLVATDRTADKAHVLRGIPGGGKTVAASAVVRSKRVRRSFKAGVFWVQVGQVGTGNPTPLLKGVAEDLAHAPSSRPRAVPHEFRDAEHVISHLVGVLGQGSLRCLVVLDDVWDLEIVPLFLRTGFHCLVTTRDLAVVPRHLRGTCTPVDMLTETEALELLKNASRATASIPRDEGLKVACDCGFLPLAIGIIGAMGSSRVNPHSPETWRGVHARLVEEPTLVQDHVGGALAVSFRELNEKARARFRKLGVLVRGVRAPVDMVAHLWEQDPADTVLLLSDLVDKSLVRVAEQSYYLHDLVLDFAKDELSKLRGKVQLVTSRQAQYLGTISVLEGYARAGLVSRGFYDLMALWKSVEDLSGDEQMEVRTYGASLKALEESEPTADVADTNWSVGRLFELQGKLAEAEPPYKRSLAINEILHGPDHPRVATGLNNLAELLRAQGKLAEADPLNLRAIEIGEKALGPEHPDLAVWLNNRAALLDAQRKLDEAGPLYVRATEIWEKALGPDHPQVATALNNRALLLKAQGNYDQAGKLYERSLAIREKALGPDHPDVAASLNNRAELLRAQGRLDEAGPLYVRATEIWEKALGPDHPTVATALNNRAGLLEDQGKLAEADPFTLRAIEIGEKALGPEHPDLAVWLNNRAGLLKAQGKFSEAEPLYKRTQEIFEKSLGRDHPNVATILNNRAGLLEAQGKLEDADLSYVRVLEILGATVGEEHPNYASTLNNRAGLLKKQGNYDEAGKLYERSLAIREKALGPDHPGVAQSLNNRAELLRAQGKLDEALEVKRKGLAIEEKVLAPDHPQMASSLNNLALLLKAQGNLAEAEPLYERCQAIREKVLGPDHPSLATTLNNRAGLLQAQGRLAEAEPLYERSLAIREKALGPDHPAVATALNNRAALLEDQGKLAEAVPLIERATEIWMKALGPEHPTVATALNNRAEILRAQGKPAEAQPLFQRALNIREGSLGVDHPSTITSRARLANLYPN